MEFEPMLTPREKSPYRKISPEEDRTRDAALRRTASPNTTNELFRPPGGDDDIATIFKAL